MGLILVSLFALGGAAGPAAPAGPDAAPARTLRVVMDDNYPPYVFRDENGQLQGILVDQWQLWEARTGIGVEVHAMAWGEALHRMMAGEFDVIDTIFKTRARMEHLDYSAPYARIEVPIFFDNEISGITGLESLKGFEVAVKEGDAAIEMLRRAGITTLRTFESYDAVVAAAGAGEVHVFVTDGPPTLHLLHKAGLQARFRRTAAVAAGEFHRAVRKGDAETLAAVERGFAAITAAELAGIDERWFGALVGSERHVRVILTGAAAALLLALIMFVWTRTLSRTVEKRTTALRESESRFRDLFEHSPVAYQSLDAEGRFLDVNDRLSALLGYPRPHLLGKSFGDFWTARTRALFPERFRRLVESGHASSELELRRADGKVLTVRLEGSVQRDAEGRFVRTHCILHNISERVEAEATLRENEERLRMAIDAAHLGTFDWNIPEKKIAWSPWHQEIWGFEPGDFNGTYEAFEARVHPDDRATVNAEIARCMAAREPFEHGFRVVWPDGSVHWVHAIGRFTYGPGGEPLRMSGVAMENTDKVLADAKVRSLARFPTENPNPVLRVKRDGEVVYANAAAATLLHFWGTRVGGPVPAEWRERVATGLETGVGVEIDVPCDGQVFSIRMVPMAGENDVNLFGRDITARKRAEEAAQAERHRFQQLFEFSPIATWLEDFTALAAWMDDLRREGVTDFREYAAGNPDSLHRALGLVRVLDLNAAAVAQNAAASKEELMNNLPRLFTPATFPGFTKGLEALWEGRSTFEYESVAQAMDGRQIDVLIRIHVPQRDGRVDHSFVTVTSVDITERKQVERTLQYQQQFLTEAGRMAHVGAWEFDPATGAGTWTEEVARIHDLDPAAETDVAVGLSVYEGESRARIEAAVREAVERGTPYDLELEMRTVQGNRKWVRTIGRPIVENGVVVKVRGSFQDITDRKRAEQVLRENEARFRQLAEGLPQLVWTCTPGGSCDYLSRQWENYTGIAADRQLGTGWLEQIHADDRGKVMEAWTAAVNAGAVFQVEYRIRRHDGAFRWFDTRAVPLRNEQGQIVKWFGSNTDIHEEHELREALRHERDRLAKVAASTPGAIYSFRLRPDGSTSFPYASPAMTEVHGVAPEDLVDDATPVFLRQHPDDLSRVQASIAESARTMQPWHDEFRIGHPAKGERWLEGYSMPVRESDGSIVWHGHIQDVTERKQAEARILKANRALRMLSESNQALVRATDEIELLRTVCRAVVDVGKYALAWVGFAEHTPEKRVRPVASAGEAREYVDTLVVTWSDADSGRGPTGTAIRTGRMSAMRNIHGDAGFAPWREKAAQFGFAASIALPLKSASGTLGALNVYSADEAAFDADECTLLTELADDLAFGITALRTKAAHARAEASLEAAQEIARMGNWEIDPESGVGLWSKEMYRLFGRDPALGPPTWAAFLDAIDPEDRAAMIAARQGVVDTGATARIAFRVPGAEGRRRDFEATISVIKDVAGRVLKIAGAVLDITERRQAEQALRESEERFRTLIEQASDLITVIDARGVIEFQSPASERVLGFAAGEMLKHGIFERLHPDDAGAMRSAIAAAVADPGRLVAVTGRFRHRDGTWRFLESVGRNIDWQAGEKRILINSRDTTAARQLEEQFRQSQKMEAVGRLAGGVAHDFNNILTVVKGNVSLLEVDENLGESTRELVAEIKRAAERAAGLTRQMLAFSRRQAMQPRDLDLNEVVTNVARMLQRLLGEDIRMELRLPPHGPAVFADNGMLEQVLVNLAVNSRDAMPDGGHLRIETGVATLDAATAAMTAGARPGDFAWLSVEDTGSGIPPELLPHLFEPFFTTKEVGRGTGLGLATVHGIVQQHEGWIEVASEVGRGTTFRVFLPHVSRAVPAGAGAAATVPAEIREGTETILFVEDEAPLRRLACSVLEPHGYRIIQAASGRQALDLWPGIRHEVDLVITDVVMPDGVNGFELGARLRRDVPDLPIVYTSGYSPELTGRQAGLGEGAHFLAKPFEAGQLMAAIRAALDERRR